jgi:H+-transporting ATPase
MAELSADHHAAVNSHASASADGSSSDPEKHELPDMAASKAAKQVEDEDDEDEDIDALIDDLESQDGQALAEEEEEEAGAGETPPISEDFLQTSTRTGLTDAEVLQRRKKFGMNQMKEEKENLILKFLGYFVGPIQFVMEVSFTIFVPHTASNWGVAHQK